VRSRPDGLGEDDLRRALAQGWRIDVADLRYAAVGGGSYHWVVRDGAGQRWFVTVDPARLAMYRLRWALDDISSFLHRLRTEHRRTADTEHAWLALEQTVTAVTGPGSRFLNC
jgi:hypothetical protein